MDNFKYFVAKRNQSGFLCVNLNRENAQGFKAIFINLKSFGVSKICVSPDWLYTDFTRISKFRFFNTICKNSFIVRKIIKQEYKYGFWVNS